MFCSKTHVFCNQLINYLFTGYPVCTENTKPSVTAHGPHIVRSVFCDFGLSIFQYGPGNQLIKRQYGTTIKAVKSTLKNWFIRTNRLRFKTKA